MPMEKELLRTQVLNPVDEKVIRRAESIRQKYGQLSAYFTALDSRPKQPQKLRVRGDVIKFSC